MTAGLANDKEIVDTAMDMFKRWTVGDKSAINPDLRSAVFAIAVKYGGEAEVEHPKSHLTYSGMPSTKSLPIKLSHLMNGTPPSATSVALATNN